MPFSINWSDCQNNADWLRYTVAWARDNGMPDEAAALEDLIRRAGAGSKECQAAVVVAVIAFAAGRVHGLYSN